MAVFASQSASLDWLFLIEVWVLIFWFSLSTRSRSPFRRRLDQFLVLLLPGDETAAHGTMAAFGRDAIQTFRRCGTLGVLRGNARRWRAPLRAVYAQGYQVATETISPPAEVARGSELVRETVAALKAERTNRGATVPTTEDPVVVLAYGLGAWPPGADLSSLELLLGELGILHGQLRNRFESLIRTIATTNQNQAFCELAGASFVLGASARIIEAADAPGRRVPPPGWLAALKTHRR
jgi:hypothetical protein